MKILPEHYDHIKQCLALLKDSIAPRRAQIKQDHRVKNPEERLRWDLLFAGVPTRWVIDTLYPYLNDEHIDTALKRIIKELESL